MPEARLKPRLPRFTTGQLMAAVLVSAFLLALAASARGASVAERAATILGTLLILPPAITLSLALSTKARAAREVMARFLLSGPLLYIAGLYFSTMGLGMLSLLELPGRPAPFPARDRSPSSQLASILVSPAAYFAILCYLLPLRCPHCGQRGLSRPEPGRLPPLPEGVELYRCEDCGARCWRQDRGPWEIDARPLDEDAAWFEPFLPRLRTLRRTMRPRGN
ncbi:MAG: hypothetical protein IRY99_03305 [Isosphaeraceae bacterium]|nr:hypothetical protein [Isosphaeraceae bacterium]